MSVLKVYTRTGTKAQPLLSFAFLPKAPTHLTRDTRTSRILAGSICTAAGHFPRPLSEENSGGVDRPTRRISRHECEKKILSEKKEQEREREMERKRESAFARIKVTVTSPWTLYSQFPEIPPPLNVSAVGGIDFSHEAK